MLTVKERIQNWFGRSGYRVVTPIPTLTYTTKYYDPFVAAQWDFSKMAPIAFSVLGDFFGNNTIVYGMVLVNIVGLVWIRQEDAAPPMFLMLILAAIFLTAPGVYMPWYFTAAMWLCIFIVTGGIIYVLYRGRRNS